MSFLLSADIGGTKTILQLCEFESGLLNIIDQANYPSKEWTNFDSLLRDFLQKNPVKIHSACFAVAGPIQQHLNDVSVNVTNLPWLLSRKSLKSAFNVPHLSLINDFAAIAHALPAYGNEPAKNEYILNLQTGNEEVYGTRAVIGAGTGLGQAIAIHNGVDYQVIGTEGGHCDFAPNNDLEIALYQFLNQKQTHVSYERLVSGEGIENLYQFYKQICQPTPAINEEYEIIYSYEDPASAISLLAHKNREGLAAKAMDHFFRLYGAQAGNFALSCLPTGGIYIAGGIALKNLELLKMSEFINCFNAKGRMRQLLEQIPVRLITDPNPGLAGATQVAMKQSHKH